MNKHDENQKHLPTPVVEKFLANQEKEIQLRSIELELTKQKDKHAFEYATKALETNKSDRDAHRQAYMKTKKRQYIF